MGFSWTRETRPALDLRLTTLSSRTVKLSIARRWDQSPQACATASAAASRLPAAGMPGRSK